MTTKTTTDKALDQMLKDMTDEERRDLVSWYQDTTTYVPKTDEEIAQTRKRPISAETIRRFDARCAEIFVPEAVYVYVPYIQMVDEFDKIQDEVDPYAVYPNYGEIRKLTRLFLLRNKHLGWMDRNWSNRRYMRATLPNNGLTAPLNGYGKKGPGRFDGTNPNITFPVGYLLVKRPRGWHWHHRENRT